MNHSGTRAAISMKTNDSVCACASVCVRARVCESDYARARAGAHHLVVSLIVSIKLTKTCNESEGL